MEKKFEEGQTNLADAIKKRQKMQHYFSEVLQALKRYTTKVENMEEDNNLQLARLISLLEESGNKQQPLGQKLSLSELASLFDSLNSEDTMETLRERLLSESFLPYQDNLKLAADGLGEMEKKKNSLIAVGIFDELKKPYKWWNSLEGTFSDYGLISILNTSSLDARRDFLLLSHVAFEINYPYLRQRQEINGEPSTTRPTIPSATSSTRRKARGSRVSHLYFNLGQSRFVINIKLGSSKVADIIIQQLSSLASSLSPFSKLVKTIGSYLAPSYPRRFRKFQTYTKVFTISVCILKTYDLSTN